MRWAAALFILAAAFPLAGCQSLAEVATKRCQALYPPGSAAYANCWHSEYEQQIRAFDEIAKWRREQERHGGY